MTELVRDAAPPPEWGVTIDEAAIEGFADAWTPLPEASFGYDGLPTDLTESEWIDFVVLAVSCVACLWPPEGEQMWATEFDGQRLDDAPGFFAAFTKERRRSGLDFTAISRWGGADVERLFKGEGVLQLLPERRARLVAVAEAAIERWGGSFANLVAEAGHDAPTVAGLLVETVPGYRDEAETDHGTLRFWKLAHLATAMIGERGPALEGLDRFPVYPDYMVPRTLRHHGVLSYAGSLGRAVDTRTLIPAHSEWELAIRWASMHAAERVLAALNARGHGIAMPTLDYWLWHASVLGSNADSMGEHHRTITMAY